MSPLAGQLKGTQYLFGGLAMNYKQNYKIAQITTKTLVSDIDSVKHH